MDLDMLRDELERDEGVRRNPYTDSAGKRTVGIGFNLEANPLPDGITFPLCDDEIDTLYNISVANVIEAIEEHLPWWRGLDETRQRVLGNMCFNLGIVKLLGFHNTLNQMQTGAYDAAAESMEASEWYKQVGNRAVRLVSAMRTGVMP